jgi:hypothetical protein
MFIVMRRGSGWNADENRFTDLALATVYNSLDIARAIAAEHGGMIDDIAWAG